MKRFFYKAIKEGKELVNGYVEAADLDSAKQKIREMGFLPAGIYEEKKNNKKKTTIPSSIKKLSLKDIRYFTSELYTLVKSGLSILDALDSIRMHSPNLRLEIFANEIIHNIQNGTTFSEALESYRDKLGYVYIALCKTGEDAGSLPETLKYLEDLLKKREALRLKLIRMSIYPSILVTLLIIFFLIFGCIVFPHLLVSMDIPNVPPIMMNIMFMSNMIIKSWWIYVLITLFICYLLNVKNEFNTFLKKRVNEFLMKFPKINDCIKYFAMSHYMAVLNIAYESGVPVFDALELAEETLPNEILKEQAMIISREIKTGKSLTESFAMAHILNGEMLSMISVGEKTGTLGEVFKEISDAVDNKLNIAISVLMQAMGPLILLMIGVGVAFFAIAIIHMYAAALSGLTF